MERLFRISPILGLLAGLPSVAQADEPLAATNGTQESAAIAYNSNADQYFTAFIRSYGTVAWQIRDADGTLIDAEYDPLHVFPSDSSYQQYRDVRVTYRPADNQYVVVAVYEDMRKVGPSGIPGLDNRLTVGAFDADTGAKLWVRDVPNIGRAAVIRTPDIMADTSPGCCTVVAWKEGYGELKAQRYDKNGNPFGAQVSIFDGSSLHGHHAFNPRLAYQASPNPEFAVVYQKSRGFDSVIQVRTIPRGKGSLGPERIIATMDANPRISEGEKFPGGPDIVYEEGIRYMVAFHDEGSLKTVTLTPNLQVDGGVRQIFTEAPPYFLLPQGPPELIQGTGTSRYLLAHPIHYASGSADYYFVQGWWLYVYGASHEEVSLSTDWSLTQRQARAAVGAYSPVTQEAFVVWDREETTLPGSYDLYSNTTPNPYQQGN